MDCSLGTRFTKLEYHLELEFSKLEYLKSGTLLISFETVLDCHKFCQNVVFGYFHPKFIYIVKSFMIGCIAHRLVASA